MRNLETNRYWGFDINKIKEDNLTLYKTGRTNANDGGIAFVMKPLGRLLGDKGYTSKDNAEHLKRANLKSGIMFKAYRNRPLTHWQKKFNRAVSKKRYRVEYSTFQ